MSGRALNHVWTRSQATGTARLVLAVLADHAGHDGTVAMPQRLVAEYCGLSKTYTAQAIKDLVQLRDLSLVDAGGGRDTPATYKVNMSIPGPSPEPIRSGTTKTAPEPPQKPQIEPVKAQIEAQKPIPPIREVEAPSGASVDDVLSLLGAAGVKPDPEQPLFWHRREHRNELTNIMQASGKTVAELRAVVAGIDRPSDFRPRRMSDLMGGNDG